MFADESEEYLDEESCEREEEDRDYEQEKFDEWCKGRTMFDGDGHFILFDDFDEDDDYY